MNNIAQEIKARVPCVRFISRYTQFKKSGTRFTACCPFKDHNDKTPSFFASDVFYKCFGCGRSGDVINFAQEYFGLSFKDGVKMIAELEGIRCDVRQSKPNALRMLLEETLRLFQANLAKNEKAKKYLIDRGIADYQKYQIGWAGNGSVPNAGIEELEKVGLAKNGRTFFRNRIMFPIYDGGMLCGFGGRSIDGLHPKYLNSPETEIFNKSEILYTPRKNLFISKEVCLVEGYTDAIALDMKGFYAAAPMGTSVTLKHFEKLWKIFEKCLDSDPLNVRGLKSHLPPLYMHARLFRSCS